MVSRTERLAYAGTQAARVVFYGAHYLVARAVGRDEVTASDITSHEYPSLRDTLTAMRVLFAKDLANAEAGLYPVPLDILREMRRARTSLRYLADIPRVTARRRRRGHNDVAA